MSDILNSRIILVKNIRMDKNYNNVLSYSEEEMLSLCQTNKVIESNTFSFIRTNQTILVNFSYETCLKANYIAFQNPDYSNKWFFAWIDDVIYKGDSNTELRYTVDSWSTWYDYWTETKCFTIREHVNDDTIGINTVNEGLSVGEVTELNVIEDISLSQYYWVGVMTSWNPSTEKQFQGITIYNKNVYGNEIFVIKANPISNLKNLLLFLLKTNIDKHIEDIGDIFIIPAGLINEASLQSYSFTVDGKTGTFYSLPFSDTVKEFTENVPKMYKYSDYTPRNNKCYVYPYNYIYASNNIGGKNIYKYEDFSNSSNATFKIQLAMSIGCSGRLLPVNYKGQASNDDESIPLAKYPTCGWSADSYTNWLTQNAINLPTQILGNFLGAGQNFITSSAPQTQPTTMLGQTQQNYSKTANLVGQIGSIATNVASSIGQFYTAELQPNIECSQNSGDVNFSAERNTFSLRQMRVKKEYLQIIDDYFTRFGYKINRVKKPNLTGRANFNFIEIGSEDVIGYGNIPNIYMDNINNACRKGVTIWHNHNNIGNFTINNSII